MWKELDVVEVPLQQFRVNYMCIRADNNPNSRDAAMPQFFDTPQQVLDHLAQMQGHYAKNGHKLHQVRIYEKIRGYICLLIVQILDLLL